MTYRANLIREVKSHLLPLSPFMSVMERLVETLPRRFVRVELKAPHQIAVVDKSKGEYRATGNTPSFEMDVDGAVVSGGGWYYLEAALAHHNGSRKVRMCAEIRDSGAECVDIPIPTNLRGTVREVFYLPANVAALRWCPSQAPGAFSQSPLLLHRITPLESALRRMCRVIFDLWRFRKAASAVRLGFAWVQALRKLQDAYQYTAALRISRLTASDYSAFLVSGDCLTESEINAVCRRIRRLSAPPLISLIMPLQVPTPEYFRKALNSVAEQVYPRWELILVGDITEGSECHSIISEYRNRNAGVKLIGAGPDMAGSFNSALEAARGEFVARINQHDCIPQHALLLLADEVGMYPEASLIYTDEDYMDESNNRSRPRFKPDWNPDLLFSYHYLSSLTLYRRVRAIEVGGYRNGFEGAEDYDLALRYLKDVPPSAIRHVPRVLYHTHVTSPATISNIHWGGKGSTGLTAVAAVPPPVESELLIHESGKRALQACFEGSGVSVKSGPVSGLYHVKHPLPSVLPLVSIIIPTRDRVDLLRACIESIRQRTGYENWEVLVVDNQSAERATHTYLDEIRNDVRFRVLSYPKPFNYSAMNNLAARHARGSILALLNNDVEIIGGEWLSEMVSHALRPGVGAVGAKLLYSNGTVQHAGVITGIGGVAAHVHKYLKEDDHGYCHRAVVTQNFSAVTGACQVVMKNRYLEVGGLNEDELVVALNDIDFCLKLVSKGYRNVFTPHALLYHHESLSRGTDDTPEKRATFTREFAYMKRTWGTVLQRDPAYNPNLSLEFGDFSLNRQIRASVQQA